MFVCCHEVVHGVGYAYSKSHKGSSVMNKQLHIHLPEDCFVIVQQMTKSSVIKNGEFSQEGTHSK
jgi:hypothetical protein